METVPIPEPTKELPGTIRPISESTIHRICSGQVILTLAIAVKELVENAIDAGATLVEVKLHKQGLESIEVSDNGTGVSEADIEKMTAKYHTSKLEKFMDLISVETFGFRGEALSSLCALSNMTIVTRHKQSNAATKIELDHEGNVAKRSPCSRSVGTTVTLTELFEPLPIRRREFTSNIKREFTKTCNLLQAYCLVAKGVRIICTNHTSKSGRTVVLQTHGAQTVLENITAIFGVRQSKELLPLEPAFANLDKLNKESFLEELTKIDSKAESLKILDSDVERLKGGHFRFEGYISSCSHGSGRSSKDRQFFYINSRPCDSKHIPKVVNEIYHRYNMHQSPFVFLNVFSDRAEVDVNVTPDKRLLFLKNEKILLLLLKKALLNTYERTAGQQKIQNISISSIFKAEPKTESPKVEAEKEEPKPKDSSNEESDLIPMSSAQNFMNVLSQWRRTGDTAGAAPPVRSLGAKRKCMNEIQERTKKMKQIQDYLSQELPNSIDGRNFASYKSESDSESEENNKTCDDTSVEKNFPSIEKINKASKEYDLITSTATVERIDCKVAGPAKSFLTFVNRKPKMCNFLENRLSDTQKPDNSTETEKASSSSSSIKLIGSQLHKLSENKVTRSPKPFSVPANSSRHGLADKQESTSLNEKEEEPSTSTSVRFNKFQKNKLLINQELKKYDSDEDSPLNAPKSPISTEIQETAKSSMSCSIKGDRSETNTSSEEEESKLPDFDYSDDSSIDFPSQHSVLKAIELDGDDETDSDMEELAEIIIKTSLEEIKAGVEAERKYKEERKANAKLKRLRFKSEIKPSENKKAEEELKTEISKSDFARMEIIGQFNLGFIIVKLDEDLFIVDQHASDEKYNFEKLQQTTVLESQRLTVPQPLNLTVVNEMVLLEHLSTFEKNGFKFEIDENAPPTQKVRLAAKPISKNWEFGKEDIDELIFMLQDAPKDSMCRPSRLRDMFASRACRKSVMIGTALEESAMKTLITHMGEIEQPWNCPHGRPTIRHLINLAMLAEDSDEESDSSSEDNKSKSDNEESDTSREDNKSKSDNEQFDSKSEANKSKSDNDDT